MTAHLLAVSIGPVQELIAAARRTRDLWFGSYLLSEVSRAVAKSVETQDEPLIFPASSTVENVANIILAKLTDRDPKVVAAQAKQAAQACWKEFAEEARREASTVIRLEIWNDQVNDVIEFYAAWVPYTDSKNYKEDRAKVMRLLAGRKNLRDFAPGSQQDAGLPKSSHDGQRATVLLGPTTKEKLATYRNRWPIHIRRKLRVGSSEQLDVLGVVKRVGAGPRPYPSVSRVAADPWIRGIVSHGGTGPLDQLSNVCQSLSSDLIHRLDESFYPQYKDFPFEGTTLFRSRHHEWWEETTDSPESGNLQKEPPNWYPQFEEQLKAVEIFAQNAGLGKEPNPYLAVLVADGDRMGQLISTLNSADVHRQFSNALASFADEARTIVNNHLGVLVYAGGDDVLAFLPVDQCLTCARKLHDTFSEQLASYGSPTLSVGLAIGHFMENLEDLLEYGRDAERHAKSPKSEDGEHQQPRDGLAVRVHKRGGGPITVCANWSDNPDKHIQDFTKWINERAISGRVAYDLRNIAKVYDGWPRDQVRKAIQHDTIAILKGKQPRGVSHIRDIETMIHDRVKDATSLRRLSEELLVARQIAVAMRQADGQPANQEVSA